MPRVYGDVQRFAIQAGRRANLVAEFHYGSLDEYYNEYERNGNPWARQRNLQFFVDDTNQDMEYAVFLNLPDFAEGDIPVDNHIDFREAVIDNLNGESDFVNAAFQRGDGPNGFPRGAALNIDLYIYRFTPEERFVQGHDFRSGVYSRIWGPLGRVNNCVIKQISERVCYYLPSGSKRGYMWRADGTKISVDRTNPDYNSEMCKRLSRDKTYQKIKAGVAAFLSRRDVTKDDEFGFDVVGLCELAELCEIRIMVYMNTRIGTMLRWDTDDKVDYGRTKEDNRYVFKFFMTSRQHLEIASETDLNTRRQIGSSFAKQIHYVDDEWFDQLFTTGYPGDMDPEKEEDCRVYTLTRSCARWPLHTEAREYKYADVVVQEGTNVFKHEVFRDWISENTDMDPDDPETSDIVCMADVHYRKLLQGYKFHNMRKIKQRSSPSLFEAVAYADKMCTHTLSFDVKIGQSLYEVDGYKWYATDFGKVEDFPYFHGYPAADTWCEYKGRDTKPVYDGRSGMFVPSTTYIGNGPGDRPFTFEYGKYAIFLIEEVDLSGCSADFVAHLARDKLLVGMDVSADVLVLPSPVLHFFQDMGVVWRASHVWVCYGCVDNWILGEGGQTGEILRAEMIQERTYPIAAGKNMAGRWPVMTTKYVTADQDTAQDLLAWYSSAWCAPTVDNSDYVYGGIPRRHCAGSLLRGERNEVYGAVTVTGSSLSRGGYMKKQIDASTGNADGPYVVHCVTDLYGTGKTYAHVSGALHAYAFVRLYQAATCIPSHEVVGFSLDSIKTVSDPSRYISPKFTSPEFKDGMFRPPVLKPVEATFRSKSCLLSNLYAPRSAFQGFATPCDSKPLWGEYQDSLGQFNVVTGPAGSGKTWRHFQKYGSTDYRLDPDRIIYAPLTNYLAALLKSQGIRSTTSFKAFNRRVDDSSTVRAPHQRYQSENAEQSLRLQGVSIVLRDEVTQDSAAMILDAIKCCEANHKQLLLVGDLTKEKFYQLSAVRNGGPDLFAAAMEEAEREAIHPKKTIKWIAPMQVFRQSQDPELSVFLDTLRDGFPTPETTWKNLIECPYFEHVSYEEMLGRIDPVKDLVANPWHMYISEVTSDVLGLMGEEDTLRIRANFQRPYKPKESDPEFIRRMALFENDPCVHKGVTTEITKRELESLKNTKFMSTSYPYAGSSSDGNMINPMIGCTVFCLQGISLEGDSVLYVMTGSNRASEWMNEDQPNQAYVTLSRARNRNQIKIVRHQDEQSARRVRI